MSEIKAVTHLGKAYQIDQEYLFSNDGTHLVYGRLKAICPKSSYPFEAHEGFLCKYIGLIQDCKDQGTITPALVPLIHGKAYTFDCVDGRDVIGLYSKNIRCFIALNEDDNTYLASGCKNIRLMTVESK
jgi:hypothetical protein